MRKTIAVLATLALTACASNPGVVKTGPNTYTVGRQAKTGFSGDKMLQLKAKAVADAQSYCAKEGKQAQVTDTSESQGPYVLGNYPRAEVSFQCVTN